MGKILAKRLKEVETDDDWFPYGNIQLIYKTVDSFHTDDELWGYLEEE